MKYKELTLGQIEAALNKLGGTEGVRRFLSGELIITAREVAKLSFLVLIDYALSIEEMVELGGHDCANPEVTSKHFPHDRTRGKEEVSLELVHFDRFISSDDAIRELEKQGLRPATLPELLAFGATYKDEQRKYPIVALGSVWRGGFGRRDIPDLWGSASRRALGLDWGYDGWGSSVRFLAARK